MVEYIRSGGGRFYKVNAAGKKTRISREVYLKRKFGVIEPKKSRKTSRRKISSRQTSRRKTSSRQTSRQTSRRKTSSRRRSKGRKYDSPLERKCRMYLNRKIKQNLKEYEQGKYANRRQALAVSYAQTLKKHPDCDKIFPRQK